VASQRRWPLRRALALNLASAAKSAMKSAMVSQSLALATRTVTFAFALLGASILPSRIAAELASSLPAHQQLMRTLVGVVYDLAIFAPSVMLVFGWPALFLPLLFSRARSPKWQIYALPISLIPSLFLVYFISSTSQQFRVERGDFPTLTDVEMGLQEVAIVRSSIGYFLYERVLIASVAGVFVTLAITWSFRRSMRRRPIRSQDSTTWAVAVAAVSIFEIGGFHGLRAVLPSLNPDFAPAQVGEPVRGLAESIADAMMRREIREPRAFVGQWQGNADEIARGAALLGWRKPADTGCEKHPFARPLAWQNEPWPEDAKGRALLAHAEGFSHALWQESGGVSHVFFFSLESFRADDLHALHGAAPRELHPFLDSIDPRHVNSRRGVLAGRRVYQAGVRTAQGIGALLCGLGTLPYNLSLVRDLSPLPLRCLSDVVADAGYATFWIYGAPPEFDRMGPFFAEHRFEHRFTLESFPASAPKGVWDAVTDDAVFERALRASVEHFAKTGASTFSWVLSLSNHSPFTPPADLPASVIARVDWAIAHSVNQIGPDDRKRLLTHSYVDYALERFFERLERSPLAENSMVVLVADHSTGEHYPWGELDHDHDTDAAKAQIPFYVVVPQAKMARLAGRDSFDHALAELQARLDTQILSQNDLPSLLLAMLSAAPPMQTLAADKRWHTLGGQITSPWFDPNDAQHPSIVGINSVSQFYAFDEQGQCVGPYEKSAALKTYAQRYEITPRLVPMVATLAELMRFQERCSVR
jgi:hypothetical protein